MVDLTRIEYLVNKEGMDRIRNRHVLVCGCGGVGSFVAEALCRSGLGHITILDCDTVEPSNLNRQLMTDKNPAAEVLEEIVMLTAEKLDANRFVLPLFLRAADRAAMPRLKHEMFPRLAPAFRSVFADIVKYGQARKEFRADVPVEIVTELFHSIFQAAAFSSLALPFTHNVKLKIELLLSGLAPRK